MALLRLNQASLAFGDKPLLDHVDWVVHPGERIALIGRNGEGKSTLLKVITGSLSLDSGELWKAPETVIGVLEQELPAADERQVFEVVAEGLAHVQQLRNEYDELAVQAHDEAGLQRLERLQQQLEAVDGWHLEQKVERVLLRLGLPGQVQMQELSGGWRRRVALARALVTEPDILLLDEPTNHLDIHTIGWLEQQLLEFRGTLIFITHDRSFLQRLANRIVELDRGRLFPWEGDYSSFLKYRDQVLADEARQNALFDKKLAQEEVWIRQGIKARRTRNEGRVRALKAMRNERAERREKQGKASFSVEQAQRSGKLVVDAEAIHYSYDRQRIINDFSVRILRGDRIGLIGPNGVGKTTLLRLLLGQLQPDGGKLDIGTNLQVAYFDQLREQLDPEKTVLDNIAEGREFIEINGKRKHLIGYLSEFLFPPARTRAKVKSLSGGERNRLLLARLFSKPANVLVLDEPTNDLDLETLELLEEILSDFQGTVLLVSHDREFLDNVVTSTLVFSGGGKIREYIGGYQDWLRQGGELIQTELPQAAQQKLEQSTGQAEQDGANTAAEPTKTEAKPAPAKKKLSYKLQRELDQLPGQMEQLEAELEALQEETGAADFYQQPHDKVAQRLEALQNCEQALEQAMERWVELESM
ncbi:ATP-binding cassette domain-containing protein [Motiliproteus coralliicola]|uniref:ATP-binding protein Uup n=1 Tax=Motiliproteus coralliicola TaxID=2283196 RepID=A0A369WRN0_9GAMM|nr:ATP-binding cassette domain-containing protein [Motiliproteus coralliicola]RDE24317.1 ATP-binding cassette domain-containing protein [Motiliproteus coralliicola]